MAEFGTIYFSLDGEFVAVKGDVTFNLSGGSKSFTANMDGSLHTSFERQPYTAEISSVSASATDINRLRDLYRRCSENGNGFTAVFDMSGECATGSATTITFINALLGGQIALSGQTGEVSGLVVAAPEMRTEQT